MPKLRHLAILTHQPEKLANFYKHVFEMKELYRTGNGSVHLSDGEVNLAILNANDPKEPGHPPGLYHFGFHVDDHATIAKRIEEIYPEGAPKARPKGTSYAETRGSDPDGNLFDISTWGWGEKTLPKEKGEPGATREDGEAGPSLDTAPTEPTRDGRAHGIRFPE